MTFLSARPSPASAILRDVPVLRQQRGLEEGALERAGLRHVHLAEAAALADHDRPGMQTAGTPRRSRRAPAPPRAARRQYRHHPVAAPPRGHLPYVHRASFREPQLVFSSTPELVPALASTGLRTRPRSEAIRSPEISIPTMIAAPKTMNCIPGLRPRISSICVSRVSPSFTFFLQFSKIDFVGCNVNNFYNNFYMIQVLLLYIY